MFGINAGGDKAPGLPGRDILESGKREDSTRKLSVTIASRSFASRKALQTVCAIEARKLPRAMGVLARGDSRCEGLRALLQAMRTQVSAARTANDVDSGASQAANEPGPGLVARDQSENTLASVVTKLVPGEGHPADGMTALDACAPPSREASLHLARASPRRGKQGGA